MKLPKNRRIGDGESGVREGTRQLKISFVLVYHEQCSPESIEGSVNPQAVSVPRVGVDDSEKSRILSRADDIHGRSRIICREVVGGIQKRL